MFLLDKNRLLIIIEGSFLAKKICWGRSVDKSRLRPKFKKIDNVRNILKNKISHYAYNK